MLNNNTKTKSPDNWIYEYDKKLSCIDDTIYNGQVNSALLWDYQTKDDYTNCLRCEWQCDIAKCPLTNAECFNGCTYEEACNDIRNYIPETATNATCFAGLTCTEWQTYIDEHSGELPSYIQEKMICFCDSILISRTVRICNYINCNYNYSYGSYNYTMSNHCNSYGSYNYTTCNHCDFYGSYNYVTCNHCSFYGSNNQATDNCGSFYGSNSQAIHNCGSFYGNYNQAIDNCGSFYGNYNHAIYNCGSFYGSNNYVTRNCGCFYGSYNRVTRNCDSFYGNYNHAIYNCGSFYGNYIYAEDSYCSFYGSYNKVSNNCGHFYGSYNYVEHCNYGCFTGVCNSSNSNNIGYVVGLENRLCGACATGILSCAVSSCQSSELLFDKTCNNCAIFRMCTTTENSYIQLTINNNIWTFCCDGNLYKNGVCVL